MDQSADQTSSLSLDQEFSLRLFADQVQQLSHQQALELLVEQHRLMMVREQMYQKMLKHEWKLDLEAASL